MRNLPISFFCIGTQKAGTTTLHDILKHHPDIFLPEKKETHFFNADESYAKGLDWYKSVFYSNYNSEKIAGEFTPAYSFFSKVPGRISSTFGNDMKFIFVLRQPIDRALSHHMMSKRRGYEDLEFIDAISREQDRIKKGLLEMMRYSYISRGKYAEQLKRYLEFYPRENFLILRFETDIVRNIDITISKLQEFLGVEKKKLNTDRHSNKSFEYRRSLITDIVLKPNAVKQLISVFIPKKTQRLTKQLMLKILTLKNSKGYRISDIEKNKLTNLYFASDIKELESLTDNDFSAWINKGQSVYRCSN